MRNDEKATGLLTLRMTCCWAAWVWYRPRLNESAAIDIVLFHVKMFNKRNLHLEERNSEMIRSTELTTGPALLINSFIRIGFNRRFSIGLVFLARFICCLSRFFCG